LNGKNRSTIIIENKTRTSKEKENNVEDLKS